MKKANRKSFGRLIGTKDSLRGQLTRGGAGSLILRVVALALSLVLSVILARVLGPEQLGIYAFAMAVITVLAIPVQAGMPALAMREIAGYEVTGQWGKFRGFLQWINLNVVLFAALVILLAALVAWVWGDQIDSQQLATFRWALLLLPLMALGALRGAVIRGMRKVVLGQLPEQILRPFFLIVTLAAVLLWGGQDNPLTPFMAMGLHAAAAALAFVTGAWILWRLIPASVKAAKSEYETKAWYGSLLPLSFIAGMSVISGQTDIIMLGILTDTESVGLYRVALQGGLLVVFAFEAIRNVIAPHIARNYRVGELNKVQTMLTWATRMTLLGAFPIALVLIFQGEWILSWVFGEAYSQSYMTLAILCVGQLLMACFGPVQSLLRMTGKEGIIARSVIMAAVANILLNALLIPRMGIEGAALATTIVTVAWSGYLVWQAYRHLGLLSLPFSPKAGANGG